MLAKLRNYLFLNSVEQCILRIFSSWIMTTFLFSFKFDNYLSLDACRETSIPLFLILLAGIFFLLSLLLKSFSLLQDEHLLIGSTLIYGIQALNIQGDAYYLVGICVVFLIIFAYCYPRLKHDLSTIQISDKHSNLVILGLIIICTAFIGGLTIMRYLCYKGSNFDLGIFVQTFYNLKEHLTQDNTCERNMAISHLQVHASFIYYLFTPIYWLAPRAETLLLLQAIAISSGLIPITLICRKYKISNFATILFAAGYIFAPGILGGCFYDFHENAFLLPLILWMFYCYESNHTKLMYVFALAVCLVKEDAGIYVLIFALYLLISKGKKEFKKSIPLLSLAIIYLIFVFNYMTKLGLGIMSYRFDNLMTGDSLFSVIHTAIANPAYLVTQMFTEDKWGFTLFVMLPLAGIPFITKKYSKLVLLIPFVFFNLLPDYEYMHSIFFQYVFGPAAFLLYLSITNLSDMKPELRTRMLMIAFAFSTFCFAGQIYPRKHYVEDYKNDSKVIQSINDTLSLIPDDASVTATTFFIPKLGNREEIYMLKMDDVEQNVAYESDYIAIDRRGSYLEEFDAAVSFYQNKGYETVVDASGSIILLRKVQ